MIKPGIYEHYKGNRYQVIGIANHSETLEKMVVYKALYGEGEFWVRPLSMWEELVEVNGKQVPRFRYIGEQNVSLIFCLKMLTLATICVILNAVNKSCIAGFQTVDKVSKEALFFLAKNAEIWYNKVKKNK